MPLAVGDRTTGIGVKCSQCGHTTGHYDLTGETQQLRCDECQRFAEKSDRYCGSHELRYDRLPGSGCPACAEENRVERQRQEQITRDRRVEPY